MMHTCPGRMQWASLVGDLKEEKKRDRGKKYKNANLMSGITKIMLIKKKKLAMKCLEMKTSLS